MRRFVCNYTDKTLDFMHLLKKDTPFIWDDVAKHAFDTLKHVITHEPML